MSRDATAHVLLKCNAQLRRERDGWKEAAAHFANGQDFYRRIVCQVGAHFGEAARVSDDGSVQEDVLALKVPELVAHRLDVLERENTLLRELMCLHRFAPVKDHRRVK